MTASIPTVIPSASNLVLHQWRPATWEDYLALRDDPVPDRMRLFFNQGWLWIDMGGEEINHASVSDLFTMLFVLWAIQRPERAYSSLGRCLIEKPNTQACAPDLVLYVGEHPRWQKGEPRRIDLTQWRVPDLVGEISDTTLPTDLDEQKKIYATLKIPEYWVVDVRGRQVFAFQLQEGIYQQCTHSIALTGLPISLLEQTLERLSEETNTSAAAWFAREIVNLQSTS